MECLLSVIKREPYYIIGMALCAIMGWWFNKYLLVIVIHSEEAKYLWRIHLCSTACQCLLYHCQVRFWMSVIIENRVVSQKWWTNWDLFLFYFAMRKGICLLKCSCYIYTYIVLGYIKGNKNPFYVSWLLLKYKMFAGWVSGLLSMQSSVTHNSARISMFCNISFT